MFTIIFGSFLFALTDMFNDGLPAPAQAYLKVCSALSEASLSDVKGGGPLAILASQEQEGLPSSPGTTVQRRSVVCTEEIVSLNFPFIKNQSIKNQAIRCYFRYCFFASIECTSNYLLYARVSKMKAHT